MEAPDRGRATAAIKVEEPTSATTATTDGPNTTRHWTTPFFLRQHLPLADALRYAGILEQNEVEPGDSLDEAILKDMGVMIVGHRLKILKGLRDALAATARTEAAVSSLPPPPPPPPPTFFLHDARHPKVLKPHLCHCSLHKPAPGSIELAQCRPPAERQGRKRLQEDDSHHTAHGVPKRRKTIPAAATEAPAEAAARPLPPPTNTTTYSDMPSATTAAPLLGTGPANESNDAAQSMRQDLNKATIEVGQPSACPYEGKSRIQSLVQCVLLHGAIWQLLHFLLILLPHRLAKSSPAWP